MLSYKQDWVKIPRSEVKSLSKLKDYDFDDRYVANSHGDVYRVKGIQEIKEIKETKGIRVTKEIKGKLE